MTQPRAAAEQENAQRHPKLRGKPWPKGVSGNPSGSRMSKRFSVLYGALAEDLGTLGALDAALLSQAVSLMVRAERVRDVDDAVRLAHASARLLSSLRKKHQRQPTSGVTLAQYLAAKAASPDDGEAA